METQAKLSQYRGLEGWIAQACDPQPQIPDIGDLSQLSNVKLNELQKELQEINRKYVKIMINGNDSDPILDKIEECMDKIEKVANERRMRYLAKLEEENKDETARTRAELHQSLGIPIT